MGSRTTKGYEIKFAARRTHISLGDDEWAEIFYEGLSPLDAARKGKQVIRFISATKLPDITDFVSTNADIYFDLTTTRSQVFISKLSYGLHTTSDNFHMELGYCATAGGVGTFTALTPELGFHVGNSQIGAGQDHLQFNPPISVRYTGDGAKSVTLRFNANDTSAQVNAAWYGFYEQEF